MSSVRQFGLRRLAGAALGVTATIALAIRAQDAKPATQATTQPAATQPATTQSASTQPGATTQSSDAPPNPAQKLSMNFKDVPLDTVLEYLSSAGGFSVIKDGPIPEGRVTAFSKQPVDSTIAITMLNAALKNNGLTAIQDGRVLKVVQRDKIRKANIPVYYGSDPDKIAATEELITQVIPLRNLDATKIKGELEPLRSPDSDITAATASNVIIITDSSANIRRIAQIIKTLDSQEASSTELKIRQLNSANAVAAAKLITEVFKPSGGGGGLSPQQIQQMQMQGQPIPPGGGGAASAGIIPGNVIEQARGRVAASADERTNTIVVTAPAGTMVVIEDILNRLDADQSAGTSKPRRFPLKFAGAEEMSKLIKSVFKGDESSDNYNPWGGYYGRGGGQDQSGKVKVETAFDERTNSVIVTAPGPTLTVIAELIAQLDEEEAIGAAKLEVFHLKNGDAWDISFMLEEIFQPKDTESDSDRWRSYWYGMPRSQQKPAKMTAVSDDRTNSVIVTAPIEMLGEIARVIEDLDKSDAAEESLFIYKLRNAQADNLEIVLNTLFGNINPPQNQEGQTQDQRRQEDFRQNRESRSSSNDDSRQNRRSNRNNNYQRRNGSQLPAGLARAETELTGKVFVVADTDTNALLVTTATRYREQVRQIIDELDRPAPQVLIKVLVAEVTHNDAIDYGVDFSILNRRANGQGQTYGVNLGNAAAAAVNGGLVISVLESDFTATLHALAIEGKLEVLSRPYILASDNQLASILVGQEYPRITNTTISDNGQQYNTYDYKDIGVILDVTPHINLDGQVILDVAPEISAITDSDVVISPGVPAPIINKRSAESRVKVQNGQTIVIGGLMEDRRVSTVDKVPLIADIPIIGEAFKRTRHAKVKTELLIFLTPHVAERTDGLEERGQDEVQGTKLMPDAVEPGMFQSHMEGMKRGAAPASTRPSGARNGPFIPTGPADDERPNGATTAPSTQKSANGPNDEP
jgi:type II secretion system protein D